MVTSAFVFLWNQRVGAVSWDKETATGYFEYDPAFRSAGIEPAPLLMPVRSGVFGFPELSKSSTFQGLPGLVADVLPDAYGNALINAWLARNGRPSNSLNPVEVLCFIGTRAMGALEFKPIDPPQKQEAATIELDGLVKIADKILNGRTDFIQDLSEGEEEALREILKIGTSVGGARAKALIAYNERTGQLRSGQAKVPKGYTHWLIKFDGVMDAQFGASSGYGRVEMAYYQMAKDAGISMMESRLLEENGRAHFMTKRFDRLPGGEKLHVQTFCAMRHLDFQQVYAFSYEELFETMRALRLTYPEAQEMYRRMVFNVAMRNCDDHTKNFAFVMDLAGRWSLAPAYDVCHAYRPGSPWVSKHALSINGKREEISRDDLLVVGRSMNIKNAKEIIDQVVGVAANWKTYAQAVEVPSKLTDSIARTLILL